MVCGWVYLNIDVKDFKDLNVVCDLVLWVGMEDYVFVKKVVDFNRLDIDIFSVDWFGKILFMLVYLILMFGCMVKEMVILVKIYDV